MAGTEDADSPAWVHAHSHEPNLVAPGGDGSLLLQLPGGSEQRLTVADLAALPYREVAGCLIVSTGHGTSGPFVFGGVALVDLLVALVPAGGPWHYLDVWSADGFGARLTPADLDAANDERPILLAYRCDGEPLTRARGLVRLVVPTEVDDALRQVKWVSHIQLTRLSD